MPFIFLKQTTYETNYFWENWIITKSNFLLADVYVTNCYFCIFYCHFILKSTFFQTSNFQCSLEILPEDFMRLPSIYFILFKKYFCVFFKCQHYIHFWLGPYYIFMLKNKTCIIGIEKKITFDSLRHVIDTY